MLLAQTAALQDGAPIERSESLLNEKLSETMKDAIGRLDGVFAQTMDDTLRRFEGLLDTHGYADLHYGVYTKGFRHDSSLSSRHGSSSDVGASDRLVGTQSSTEDTTEVSARFIPDILHSLMALIFRVMLVSL